MSAVLKMSVTVTALIPEKERMKQYAAHEKKPVKYQVLYLLHGFSGDAWSYIRSSDIEKYADEHQIIVVTPSAYNSAYTDFKYGLDYFTYVSDELFDFIERTFPVSTKREDTFIAGMSMGGYGAYKLGLTYPERFAAIGGVAGSYHAEYRYQGKVTTVSTLCEGLYGDPPQIDPEIHDIFTMMKNLKDKGSYIPRMYTCAGYEDRRYQDSVDLKKFADSIDVPLTFENSHGHHDMVFFNEYIQKILDWMDLKNAPVEI